MRAAAPMAAGYEAGKHSPSKKMKKEIEQKAVAESVDSNYSPKKRTPLTDAGGESEVSGDATKVNVKDLQPSETVES